MIMIIILKDNNKNMTNDIISNMNEYIYTKINHAQHEGIATP